MGRLYRIEGLSAKRIIPHRLTEISTSKKTPKSLKQSLTELVKILEEERKYSELIEDKSYFKLKIHNCLFYDIVMEETRVCKVTETLMSELTNNLAIKENCFSDGDS